MLLSVDDGSGCPGDMAVAVSLDEQKRITREERYHRIDSLGRCTTGALSGWWDSTPIPDAAPVVRTGTMDLAGFDVAIWNGTPDPSPLVRWAVQRFADAGLTPPIPTSVTFLPRGDDPWSLYGFAEGSSAPDLALPFPAPRRAATRLHARGPLGQGCDAAPARPRVDAPGALHGPPTRTAARAEPGDSVPHRARPGRGPMRASPGSGRAHSSPLRPSPGDSWTSPTWWTHGSDTSRASSWLTDFTLLARAPADPRACAERSPGSVTATAIGHAAAATLPPAPAPWVPVEDARTAVTWFTTYANALRQGLANIPAFYARRTS